MLGKVGGKFPYTVACAAGTRRNFMKSKQIGKNPAKKQVNAKVKSRENKIPKGASPLLDRVFKYLYLRENKRSRANLRQLMSIILGRNVVSAEPQNNEVLASTKPSTEKASRYDIRVLLDNGERADIEVQLYDERDDYAKRLAYYGAKLYASQNVEGKQYAALQNCYQVMISKVQIFPNTEWLLNFDITARENPAVKFEGMRWIVIQLNYLKAALQKDVGKDSKYLKNLLKLCTFLDKPEKSEPFTDVYRDYMRYWTADEIKAYQIEMEERARLDRASSKAFTANLLKEQKLQIKEQRVQIKDQKVQIKDQNQEIKHQKVQIAKKNAEIVGLSRKNAGLSRKNADLAKENERLRALLAATS